MQEKTQMAKRIQVKAGEQYGRLTVIREVAQYVSPSGRRHLRAKPEHAGVISDCKRFLNIAKDWK